MRKLSTIIVDDDPTSVKILHHDLNKYPEMNVVEAVSSPLQAIDAIENHQPDVLFLDMEMDGMSGLELLQNLSERGCLPKGMKIVFYTGYDKYMLDAIRSSAFDFLLKPYKAEELQTVIERLSNASDPDPINTNNYEQSIRKLITSEQRFTLQSITGLLILHHSQVICFRYIDHLRCWQVTLTDRQSHRLRTTTKAQDITGINSNFKQISNSCIINVEYLACIENKTMRCKLYPPFSDLEIYVSRHFFTELRNSLNRM